MPDFLIDIETAPHPDAVTFVPPPDLSQIRAAGNLKDPDKITADIAKRQQAAIEEHAAALGRCALDWNLSRIVAVAYCDVPNRITTVRACRSEAEEASVLREFWHVLQGGKLIGFCARTFDAPTLLQRSRLLRVPHPLMTLGRYGHGDVTDLRDILTFDDARYEAIMPRSLKAFCRRFDIPVPDAIDGADVPQLVSEGRWDDVVAHCRADLDLNIALAERLRVIHAAGISTNGMNA